MEPAPYERRPRRRGLGWLWALVGLILLALLVLLLVRACDGDGDGDEPASGSAATETTGSGTTDGGGSGSVSLDELLAASGGSLARWNGSEVEVTDAEVLSVVGDAGFWIGSGDAERVFVEINDETGLDDRGVERGDVVSFPGRVQENLEAETYGLRGEDAELFRRQGAHLAINAGELEIS